VNPDGRDRDPLEAGPGEFVFSFYSVKGAIVAERRLLDEGLPVRVMPSPPQIGPGCGICLRVKGGDLEKARMILGSECQGIFRRTGTGRDFIPWNP
jgi:hypothetical protein